MLQLIVAKEFLSLVQLRFIIVVEVVELKVDPVLHRLQIFNYGNFNQRF